MTARAKTIPTPASGQREGESFEEYVRRRTAELPVEEATPEELAAIEEGMAAYRRGEYVTLDELRRDLAASRRKPSPRGRTKRT